MGQTGQQRHFIVILKSCFVGPQPATLRFTLKSFNNSFGTALVEEQDKISELLEAKKEGKLNGFITERSAMHLISKKTTWFWQMRETGRLLYKKIGKTTCHAIEDINALLENDSQ